MKKILIVKEEGENKYIPLLLKKITEESTTQIGQEVRLVDTVEEIKELIEKDKSRECTVIFGGDRRKEAENLARDYFVKVLVFIDSIPQGSIGYIQTNWMRKDILETIALL
tara:strand:- start:160 stop:492 length:333 start_codon:yes stop_codon:yes gene_type:complete